MNMVRRIESILNKMVFCFLLVSLILQHRQAIAQDKEIIYDLGEDIVVTANRIPTAFSDVARSITVIDKKTIENAPAKNIHDLLETVAGVDVSQQGPNGVQSHFSIRGASFKQTLVLIDGIKISDPQTAHHNSILFLSLKDIEKIEILKGQGSKLYGPNAFGGVINIITKKGQNNSLSLQGIYGENNLYDGSVFATLAGDFADHRLSVSKKNSDGYRENTSFDILNANYGTNFEFGEHSGNFLISYEDKKFGANNFYGVNKPGAKPWEHITTVFGKLNGILKFGSVKLAPAFYWRNNKDNYIYNYEHPEWYENNHETDSFGVELHSTFNSLIGLTGIGIETGNEVIESNNLGNHDRNKSGVFLEHQLLFDNLRFVIGASGYYYSGWGWNYSPGFEAGYKINQNNKIYFSSGKSFRIPTYTELYYEDKENIGNKDLKPEEAWSYEIGYGFSDKYFSANISSFIRNGENIIDYVFLPSDTMWLAKNFSKVNITGFEVDISYLPSFSLISIIDIDMISISYAYMDSDKETGNFNTKYSLNHLKHQVGLGLNYSIFTKNLKQSWKIRYEDRLTFGSQFLVDTWLSYQMDKIKFFIDATNIFDQKYKEYNFLPMPGRWLKAGVEFDIM